MAAAPQKAADNAGEEKKGGKKKLLLIVGLAVLLVAISIGGTVAVLKFLAPHPDSVSTPEEKAPEPLAPAIYYQLDPNFTITFNVNGRQRFLQAQITLLYRDEALEPLLKLHMPVIRNGLVMLLSSKQFDSLQTSEGKEALRAEALAEIQGVLRKEQAAAHPDDDKEHPAEYPNIEQVLFTNFVMQ